MAHYYGDGCPNGHFAAGTSQAVKDATMGKIYPPSAMKRTTVQVSTGADGNRIRKLIEQALVYFDKAMECEQLANDRLDEIIEETIQQHTRLARQGNPMSKRLIENPRQLSSMAELRASGNPGDPIWKAHVANNQFYTRKADLANGMAQTLLQLQKQENKE